MSSSICQFISSLFHNVGMEVALFMYMFTSFLKTPVFQNLIFEKACLERYDQDMQLCTNVTAYYADQHIQSDANHFYSISSYVLMFPSLVTTLLLGVVTDFYSIKIPLIIPFVGLILGTTNYIIQTVYMHVNIYWLLVSDGLFGCCGGYIAIISTTFSYGVKTTSEENRSYRIAAMEGAIGLGGTIGYALSGTIREALGYAYTFVLILVVQVVAFVYILVMAKDKEYIRERDGGYPKTLLQTIGWQLHKMMKDFYVLLTVRRQTRTLISLNLLALGLELLIFAGLADIQYSYLRYKLAWNDKQYGWYSGLSYGITTLAVLTLYPLLRSRGTSDGQLGCVGILFKIVSLFMLAFVVNAAMAYSVTVVTMFNRFVSSGFRAFLSCLVLSDEQGKMFSLIALLEGVTNLMATAIYNNIYPLTLSFFPGLCYVASALLLVPSVIILGYSDFLVKRMLFREESETSLNSTES